MCKQKTRITVIFLIVIVMVCGFDIVYSEGVTENYVSVSAFEIQEQKIIKKKEEAEKREAERKAKEERINKAKTMTLKQLDENGFIQELCDKYDLNKQWFDNVSMTESTYGKYTPDGSYNAWGWGIYDGKIKCMGDNWYDASEKFIREFKKNYGSYPTQSDMLRYCPGGAYSHYFE